MTLNKKISLITIAVVFGALLLSSVVHIRQFRQHYTQALLTGSFSQAHALNDLVNELLSLGLPLPSLDGLDKKLARVVEKDPNIDYAAIVDLTGRVLFHSDPALIGVQHNDASMQRSLSATEPVSQIYPRLDGKEYYDVTVPVFDVDHRHIAAIRLGFPTQIINDKLEQAIVQVGINFLLAFAIIALLLNQLLARFITRPVIALSAYAKQIADGHFDAPVPQSAGTELAGLSQSLQQLAATLAVQMRAMQQTQEQLETQVQQRTEELAGANERLQGNNQRLEIVISRLKQSQDALIASENKFRSLFEASSDCVLLIDDSGIVDCNPAALSLFQVNDAQRLYGKHLADLSPAQQLDGTDSQRRINQYTARAFEQGPQLFEWLHQRLDDQHLFNAEVLLTPVFWHSKPILQAQIRDITARKLAEQRDMQRQNVMERLLRGESLSKILESIARNIEQEQPDVLCSILLLDDDGKHLLTGAAPSLPDSYNAAVHGIAIGEGVGSCGTAAFLAKTVIVDDIQQHPYWAAFRELAAQAGLKACWSQPIFGSHDKILGTFAIYQRQIAQPGQQDFELIEHASKLCAIAIERSKNQTQQQLAATVFAYSYEGIMITDANHRIIDVNPAFTRITGYERHEIIGQSPKILQSGRQDQSIYQQLQVALQTDGHWQGEIWNRRKNGEVYAEMLAIAAVRDDCERIINFVAVFSDISRIKAHEQELDRIAHYDPLTNLPNRRLFSDRMQQALAHASRNGTLLAVCYLDLDGFKPVNDSYGHEAGDQLLIEISSRLKACIRSDDTLARLGGDEFVLLLGELTDPQECGAALDRALNELARPVMIGDTAVSVSASIGVALYPHDEVDGDTLLRHADQAMYQAKQAGKNRYHLFDPQQDRAMQDRQNHALNLLQALRSNEFLFYYQPKVDLLSGELIGAEALIRWQHPQHGLLSPAAFMEHFVDAAMEIELGEWVIASALKQMVLWQNQQLQLRVSVNISARHLLSGQFVARLQQLLADYPQVSPAQLELEVLETAAMDDIHQAIEVMTQCKALGVNFALDDFGTGYSSLAYFRRLPVDMLKIDQVFVRDMLEDREDFTIVESVVRLAQAFNRPVIAEGVETMDHAARLIQLGCTLGQGYGIARPMPADNLMAWLQEWQLTAPWQQLELPAMPIEDLPLVVAAQSHLGWIEQLQAYLAAPQQKRPPPLDSEQCAFGHWCRGSGLRHYGHRREFQHMNVLHERIHQLAQEMADSVHPPDVSAALERELFSLRDQLLESIEAMRNQLPLHRRQTRLSGQPNDDA